MKGKNTWTSQLMQKKIRQNWNPFHDYETQQTKTRRKPPQPSLFVCLFVCLMDKRPQLTVSSIMND